MLSARIAARSATPAPALGGAQLQSGAAQNVPVPGRAPLASRIKAVLDVLSANREFHSLETLTSRAGISIFEDEELRHELSQHPNIEIVTESYRYKPKTPGIFNRQDLLRHLRQLTTAEAVTDKGLAGVKVGAVDDAYIGVMDDIKILQRDGHIYKFDHTHNAAEAVLFYNERDPRMGLNIQVSMQHTVHVGLTEHGCD